ncbi:hypothetical protein EI94DRAFT_1810058 [Lactarius quietus]|nr:hypothetical protein EI94DRAFT_1810058 [Lactarius quietus]
MYALNVAVLVLAASAAAPALSAPIVNADVVARDASLLSARDPGPSSGDMIDIRDLLEDLDLRSEDAVAELYKRAGAGTTKAKGKAAKPAKGARDLDLRSEVVVAELYGRARTGTTKAKGKAAKPAKGARDLDLRAEDVIARDGNLVHAISAREVSDSELLDFLTRDDLDDDLQARNILSTVGNPIERGADDVAKGVKDVRSTGEKVEEDLIFRSIRDREASTDVSIE